MGVPFVIDPLFEGTRDKLDEPDEPDPEAKDPDPDPLPLPDVDPLPLPLPLLPLPVVLGAFMGDGGSAWDAALSFLSAASATLSASFGSGSPAAAPPLPAPDAAPAEPLPPPLPLPFFLPFFLSRPNSSASSSSGTTMVGWTFWAHPVCFESLDVSRTSLNSSGSEAEEEPSPLLLEADEASEDADEAEPLLLEEAEEAAEAAEEAEEAAAEEEEEAAVEAADDSAASSADDEPSPLLAVVGLLSASDSSESSGTGSSWIKARRGATAGSVARRCRASFGVRVCGMGCGSCECGTGDVGSGSAAPPEGHERAIHNRYTDEVDG